jgi:hypothetical protein
MGEQEKKKQRNPKVDFITLHLQKKSSNINVWSSIQNHVQYVLFHIMASNSLFSALDTAVGRMFDFEVFGADET